MIRDGISRPRTGVKGAAGVASCLIQYSIYLTSFRCSEISAWTPCWYRLSCEGTWTDACSCQLGEPRLCLTGLSFARLYESVDVLLMETTRWLPTWVKLTYSSSYIVVSGLYSGEFSRLARSRLEPLTTDPDRHRAASARLGVLRARPPFVVRRCV